MTGISALLVAGLAALSGVGLGIPTGAAAVWLTQSRRARCLRLLRDLDQREDVYVRFIEQASETWLEALEVPRDPANLIGLCALVGRMRIGCTTPVLEAAEAMLEALLDTWQQPSAASRPAADQPPQAFMSPMAHFTAACRAEREQTLRAASPIATSAHRR
jgi:hypothetical protein